MAVLREDERYRILTCGWQQLQFSVTDIDYNFFYYLPVSILDIVCNYTWWECRPTSRPASKCIDAAPAVAGYRQGHRVQCIGLDVVDTVDAVCLNTAV